MYSCHLIIRGGELALLNVPPALSARSTVSVCSIHRAETTRGCIKGFTISAGSKEAENLAPKTNENPEPMD